MFTSPLALFAIIIALSQIFIGLTVFIDGVRNHKLDSKLFFALVITSSIWTVTNVPLIGVTDTASQLSLPVLNIFNKLGFATGGLTLITMLIFILYYPEVRRKTLLDKVLIGVGSIVSLLSMLDVVSGKFTQNNSNIQYQTGALSAIMIVLILAVAIRIFTNLKTKTTTKKVQVAYIKFGLLLTLLHAAFFIFIMPALVGQNDIIYAVGYIAPIYFLGFTLVSLLKHSFLDIRLVIARSAAYISTLVILSAAYFLLVIILGGQLLRLGLPASFENLFYLIFTIILALTFNPLKAAFNKVTNRLFYQDAYDTQDILDKVSTVIVGNVDPHKVQTGALTVLHGALRPAYALFVLLDSNDKLRLGHMIGQQWRPNNTETLQAVLNKLGKRITVYDTLEDHQGALRRALLEDDINLVAPLVTKDETIGYLIMGQKKSGSVYNAQDLGLLNIATNELAVALQNAQRFEEIQAFNVTLQEKITEATKELKSTNKKLVALDEAKDEFISMASHQLRTPLTSIKGYISMLLEGDLGKLSTAQQKALKEAFGSSQRMVYLIADFLNVSRIKTGKFVIEAKEVDLPQIVAEEITQLREMADSRSLELVYEQPEVFPHVKLDDNKIRQVMMNMVDNAIYYTPSGGTITIQLYATADEVIFKVIDTGIGVSKTEQHKLFTKFFRASNARKARPDGTGLGLFMAQKIVVAQGGAIIFESTEGKGSTFGFRFPLSKIRA